MKEKRVVLVLCVDSTVLCILHISHSSRILIVSCRLKPHNAFRGAYESGPCKMMTVGLGKQTVTALDEPQSLEFYHAGNILTPVRI